MRRRPEGVHEGVEGNFLHNFTNFFGRGIQIKAKASERMPRRPRPAHGAANRQGHDLDVEALVKQMLNRLSDVDFLVETSGQLAEHAHKVTEVHHARMNTALVLAASLQLMRVHPGCGDLQANIVSLVSRCTQASRPNLDLFLGEGGIDMLITSMTESQGHFPLQNNAFKAILDLGEQLDLPPETKRALSRAVVVSMNNLMQPCQGEGVRHALRLDTSNSTYAIAITGEVMETADQMQMLKLGMDVLINVHLTSELSQTHAEEGINMVVKVMRTYAQIDVLQVVGCDALGAFATRKGITSWRWPKPWLSALLAGMRVALKTDCIKDDSSLMQLCCDAVHDIYRNSEHLQHQEERELTVLPDVIIKHLKLELVVRGACRALIESNRWSKMNRVILGDEAVRAVLLGLSKHKNDVGLQCDGFAAISALIKNVASNAACLFEADTLRTLLGNARLHMRHCELQHYACDMVEFIAHLCKDKTPALIEAGCLSYLAQAMRLHEGHSQCSRMVTSACRTIALIMYAHARQCTSEQQMIYNHCARAAEEIGCFQQGVQQSVQQGVQQGVQQAMQQAVPSSASMQLGYSIPRFCCEVEALCAVLRGTESNAGSESELHQKKAPTTGAKAMDVCMACGRTAADAMMKKLLKCSACTVAPKYCSAECQHACWAAHKAECKANKKSVK